MIKHIKKSNDGKYRIGKYIVVPTLIKNVWMYKTSGRIVIFK